MCRPHIPDFTLKVIDAGRLQLLNIIGSGGYGTIYRARDLSCTSRMYAVKILPKTKIPHRRLYQHREIKYHRIVSTHPNIVTFHRVVHDETYLYLIMDYCPGGNLHSILTQKHVFGRNDALVKSVFLQLIDAVQACHEEGIFHRDLKPENVLVDHNLTKVYVTDFGLATKNVDSRHFGVGSGCYLSPECYNLHRDLMSYNTRRSDIWALGMILINIVTGRCPWDRASLEDDRYRGFLRNRDYLQRMLPISDEANDICRSIFTHDPRKQIDLLTLRRRVELVDTFFMDDEDIALGPPHIKAVAEAYLHHTTSLAVPPRAIGAAASVEGATNSLIDDSDDSDEHSNGIGSRSLLDLEEGHAHPREIVVIHPSTSEDTDSTPEPRSQDGFRIQFVGHAGEPCDRASLPRKVPSAHAEVLEERDTSFTTNIPVTDPSAISASLIGHLQADSGGTSGDRLYDLSDSDSSVTPNGTRALIFPPAVEPIPVPSAVVVPIRRSSMDKKRRVRGVRKWLGSLLKAT